MRSTVDWRKTLSLSWLLILGGLIGRAAGDAPEFQITRIGIFDAEHTRTGGLRNITVVDFNQAGQAVGHVTRYSGTSSIGQSVWFFDGDQNLKIGLFDAEHTRGGNNFKSSTIRFMNEDGEVAGVSNRYSGSTSLGQSAWLLDGVDCLKIGFTDAEHTRGNGLKSSDMIALNEAGQVLGFSLRYSNLLDMGRTAWIHSAGSTIKIGFTDAAHTRNDGFRFSDPLAFNQAGQAVGNSNRYNVGSDFGQTAWFYDGATTLNVGLTDSGHTRNDGYRSSAAEFLSATGKTLGHATRYNGAAETGRSAWIHNGSSTIRLGLFDAEFTRGNDGFQFSDGGGINSAGRAVGFSTRYNNLNLENGRAGWYYNGSTISRIGFTDAPHTRNDGLQFTDVTHLTDSGLAGGVSARYLGAASIGQSAWISDGSSLTRIGLTGPEFTKLSDGFESSAIHTLMENGHAVGTSARHLDDFPAGNAVFYHNGSTSRNIGLTDAVHTDSNGVQNAFIHSINASGMVAGTSTRYLGLATNGLSGFLYDPALDQTFCILGATSNAGYGQTVIRHLTDAGVVVGSYDYYIGDAGLGIRAFYFSIDAGFLDLGELVADLTEDDWSLLSRSNFANNAGQIVGLGSINSEHTLGNAAYVLDPINVAPAPATGPAAGLLLAVLVLRHRRRAV